MWKALKEFLGIGEAQATPEAQQAVDAAVLGVVPQGSQAAANDENFSLTGEVAGILSAQLRMQQVTKYGPNGSSRPARFPLQTISLTSTDGYNQTHRYSARVGDDDADSRPHGERVTLEAELSGPIEDYDLAQLKAAITGLVGTIPAFVGKVVAKPAEPKHATYKEVEAELLPLLAKHPNAFTAAEITTLKKFFEGTPNKPDAAPISHWDSNVDASHREGKIYLRLGTMAAPIIVGEDKKPAPTVESSDAIITDYFKAHRKPVLDKMKEKVAALRKADGTSVVTMEELAALDLHATANYGIELMLGTRPEALVDATTGKKLVGEERAKKFTETPLIKVDTDKLAEIFTESLVEVSNPLPPMLEQFASGHMLAQMLRKRLPNNPELEAFIARHEMFLTREEKKAKEPKATQPDQVALDEPVINTGRYLEGEKSDQARVSVSFDLPQGMTLHQLYQHIAQSKNQMGVVARQQSAANEPAQLGGVAA